MKYIWINPVTENMYERMVLNDYLERHGYEQVYVTEDWISIVKNKYKNVAKNSRNKVLDVRCPRIKELLEESNAESYFAVPDIHPILIHCAEEISERENLKGMQKIITTPCQALADMGNKLELPDTRFITWNEFMTSVNEQLLGIQRKESPIPPGFFSETNVRTISITGEEEIRKYFEDHQSDEIQITEMLFCKNGCHNGDGVRISENG